MMFLGHIRTERQLNEGEVRAVNYIIKRNVWKFIAAGKEEWLYPENNVRSKAWSGLGGEFFLRPDVRGMGFASNTYMQMEDGTSWGMDTYGRAPDDGDPERKEQHAREWDAYCRTIDYWDRKRGKLSSAQIHRMTP